MGMMISYSIPQLSQNDWIQYLVHTGTGGSVDEEEEVDAVDVDAFGISPGSNLMISSLINCILEGKE